ncbi:MAG: NUDIX hydrolase [Hoeflea sp.]|uniref:NUDIX hydrolase n=1 Tax=Hoeflea sp. TaxID=1940281 RepID=UPI001E18B728|nr:NUDIX hydrolase [Hoeflea sp.]MBU4528391.1 NUDIX hydrolase [Alphaproteobacteria bacterium]MBU4543060.1 NUDIX hydrolase [Alphaproteobacteria bacterium]MBU4551751.1 NUDIX hydrolase [Alphaproteobacteria bacterium]MBV1723646.1 NUDIX hydrolase [Hoeflea sp.]MBV1761962.1 NUDIX hydrolase [Hoeflea sp.]
MNIKTGSGTTGPALAVSVAIEREGRFLLVLRGNPPAQHMYAFPGGRVDPDEALEDAALRELHEETGLRATNPRPFATFDLGADDPGGASHFFLTVFRVDDPGGNPVAQDDAREVGWFTPAQVRSLPVPESMVTCMEMLARGEDQRDGT